MTAARNIYSPFRGYQLWIIESWINSRNTYKFCTKHCSRCATIATLRIFDSVMHEEIIHYEEIVW